MTAQHPVAPSHGTDAPMPASLETARRICHTAGVPALLVDSSLSTVCANAALGALLGRHPTAGEQVQAALRDAGPVFEAVARTLLAQGGRAADAGVSVDLPLPDGQAPLRLRAIPIVEHGRACGVLALGDGTAMRAAEDLRSEIERAAAAKSRFLASASHDLRQPFQAMRLFLEVLQMQITDDRARQTAGLLGNAMAAGEKLLNALLDISTLDAGTVQANPQVFDLGELLADLAGEFRPQAEEKGLKLRARLFPAQVRSDPVLLERIVRNLVSNAIRYTRRGKVLLAMRRRAGKVRIEVWDTGFGIPDAQTEAIFDEFHQLENPARDPNRGLGLGLAIVRRLSALLKTPVDVHSRVGRGSVFTVTLEPAEQPEQAWTEEPAVHAAGPLAGTTVLAVDDDSMVLTGLQLSLEGWGCTVVSAGDIREVFVRLDQLEGPPDVILTDLRLPNKVTGFEVIDRVRKIYGREIPAIVLTGETGQAELAEGQRRHCAFLHKPLHPMELKRVLSQVTAPCAPVRPAE
ncbi:ATP-binding response regulator [Azospirillum sp.]|uniref:ATP-binding response regulator n=1 Tax=Azospirillum sp. TaxID=34012 RepID=UPI003D71CD82